MTTQPLTALETEYQALSAFAAEACHRYPALVAALEQALRGQQIVPVPARRAS